VKLALKDALSEPDLRSIEIVRGVFAINNVAFAVGQLAVFQGASEAPVSDSYGSIRRGGGKTGN
jgi:hypothetical protein